MKSAERMRRLHPMQAFGVVSGLTHRVRVSRLEKRLKPAVPFPHKHDFFHIVIPARGKGWHEIDFNRYDVAPCTLYVMRPAQVHTWSFSEATGGYVVEFEAAAFATKGARHASVDALLRSPINCLKARPEEWQNVIALCELMAVEQERRSHDFESVLRAELTALLLVLARIGAAAAPATAGREDVTTDFVALIDEHFREHHDVTFYAKALGMTGKALTMRVTRATGSSARDMIHARILLESKRLLAYSDLEISSVGAEVGFIDPNYFARFFRRKTGASPGAFRRQTRTLC